MVTIQPIQYDGHVVALVAGGRALIDPKMSAGALPLVQAKCLYALEIESGTLPGPYSEPVATRFAHDVLATAAKTLGERPPVIRLPARRARRVNA